MDTDIREALRRPVDPEIGVNIADLGIVYRIEVARGQAELGTMSDWARRQLDEGERRCGWQLGGYAWLGVGGAIAAGSGVATPGLLYHAMLHAVFLGFVISTVFGRAVAVHGQHGPFDGLGRTSWRLHLKCPRPHPSHPWGWPATRTVRWSAARSSSAPAERSRCSRLTKARH
jgi:hypothetical protein